jgi:hypothetical protein
MYWAAMALALLVLVRVVVGKWTLDESSYMKEVWNEGRY